MATSQTLAYGLEAQKRQYNVSLDQDLQIVHQQHVRADQPTMEQQTRVQQRQWYFQTEHPSYGVLQEAPQQFSDTRSLPSTKHPGRVVDDFDQMCDDVMGDTRVPMTILQFTEMGELDDLWRTDYGFTDAYNKGRATTQKAVGVVVKKVAQAVGSDESIRLIDDFAIETPGRSGNSSEADAILVFAAEQMKTSLLEYHNRSIADILIELQAPGRNSTSVRAGKDAILVNDMSKATLQLHKPLNTRIPPPSTAGLVSGNDVDESSPGTFFDEFNEDRIDASFGKNREESINVLIEGKDEDSTRLLFDNNHKRSFNTRPEDRDTELTEDQATLAAGHVRKNLFNAFDMTSSASGSNRRSYIALGEQSKRKRTALNAGYQDAANKPRSPATSSASTPAIYRAADTDVQPPSVSEGTPNDPPRTSRRRTPASRRTPATHKTLSVKKLETLAEVDAAIDRITKEKWGYEAKWDAEKDGASKKRFRSLVKARINKLEQLAERTKELQSLSEEAEQKMQRDAQKQSQLQMDWQRAQNKSKMFLEHEQDKQAHEQQTIVYNERQHDQIAIQAYQLQSHSNAQPPQTNRQHVQTSAQHMQVYEQPASFDLDFSNYFWQYQGGY